MPEIPNCPNCGVSMAYGHHPSCASMTPPDDAPQTGQRVRELSGHIFHLADPMCAHPTHVVHSLEPKALRAIRERFIERIYGCHHWIGTPIETGNMADALMAELGLTPPEPKEGGAS